MAIRKKHVRPMVIVLSVLLAVCFVIYLSYTPSTFNGSKVGVFLKSQSPPTNQGPSK